MSCACPQRMTRGVLAMLECLRTSWKADLRQHTVFQYVMIFRCVEKEVSPDVMRPPTEYDVR